MAAHPFYEQEKTDGERFRVVVKQADGVRLTYKELYQGKRLGGCGSLQYDHAIGFIKLILDADRQLCCSNFLGGWVDLI